MKGRASVDLRHLPLARNQAAGTPVAPWRILKFINLKAVSSRAVVPSGGAQEFLQLPRGFSVEPRRRNTAVL